MNAIISREAGRPAEITFVPHLVPMSRGMLTTIYASPSTDLQAADVHNCLKNAYSDHAFIRLCPDQRLPDTLHVKGTNFCDIGIRLDERNHRLILISAIDNLVKGASGQAVQNMNIMLGLDEATGLNQIPYPL